MKKLIYFMSGAVFMLIVCIAFFSAFAASFPIGDVNGDGVVDAADARLILRYVAKLEARFPVEDMMDSNNGAAAKTGWFSAEEAAMGDIAIDMPADEVIQKLGAPIDEKREYSEAVGGDIYTYCYNFGTVTLDPDIYTNYSVSNISVTNGETAGPRGIRIGDSLDSVLQKFPADGESATNEYDGIIYEYLHTANEEYDVKRAIEKNHEGAVGSVCYFDGYGGFGSFSFCLEIQNGAVASMYVGVQNI